MSDWPEKPLGDLLEQIIDHRGKTPKKMGGTDFTPSGVPVVSAIHIKGGRINWSERERFVPQWVFEKWMPVRLRRGDVLLTSEAPLGEVAQVPSDDDLVLSQRLFALRGHPERLDSSFLRYFFQTSRGRDRLLARASGTTVVGIRQAELVRVPIPVPPIDEQRRIAAVLGAFDDLIETNQILTDDIVRLAQSSLSCAHWPTQRVGDVAVLNRGLSYKGSGLRDESTDDCTPMVNLANFTKSGWLKTAGTKFYAEPFKPTHVLAQGDLVVANTDLTQAREILGRGVLISPAMEGAIHSHHTTSIRFPDNPVLALFLWAQLQAPSFRERALGFATGTTVTALPKEALLDYTFHVPEDWEQMAEVGQALLKQAWACEAEVADLSRARDELLPLLMAGRVRVEAVEGVV